MDPSRRVVIAGGSGFLGRTLSDALQRAGYDIVVLTRKQPGASTPAATAEHRSGGARFVRWEPDGHAGEWAVELEAAAAVVNLAGESIGDGWWTAARKQQLRMSRLEATASLVAAIHACRTAPAALVSASAVGYYGSRGDEVLNEDSSPGNDFLASLCVEWERAARAAADLTRVVLVRTGVVLDAREGALPRMLAPIKLFVGGPVGSGRQYISWIHLDDWVALVRWAIEDTRVDGPVNATASQPVNNAEFTRTAAAQLHRPAIMPAPAFAVRALFGEMGDALVVAGQRVAPKRALEMGFRFRFSDLSQALADVLAADRRS